MSSRLKFKTTSHAPSIKKIEVLQLENKRLTKENEELKARLSTYKIGVDLEGADKNQTYLIKYRKHWTDVKFKDDGWYVFDAEFQELAQVFPPHLYPLPPTQEGEE